jgi:hypothetical protein
MARRGGNGCCEGHARGRCFVHTSVSGDELDRKGAGCVHAACMGMPAHSAYMSRS